MAPRPYFIKGNGMIDNRDYVLIVDKSGSMETRDAAGGITRWESARESTFALAAAVEPMDPDGIDLFVFATNFKKYPNVTPSSVDNIWKENNPMGGTNLHTVLIAAFEEFKVKKAAGALPANGQTIIVVTDGEPSDQRAVKSAIKDVTQTMEKDEELAVLFIQAGNDAGATAFLKALDDDLVSEGAKFDIVDTIKFDEIENKPLKEVLLNAIND